MHLSVATLNTWHGLDGSGVLSFGRLETKDERKSRLKAQIEQLKLLDPDILVLEELNPLPLHAFWYGTKLGRKYFWSVANSGLKVGLGPPFNLCEGIAILTRPLWQVEPLGSCQLSGGLRVSPLRMSLRLKNLISFQLHESRIAVCVRVTIPSPHGHSHPKTLLVVGTHLHHAAGLTQENAQLLKDASLSSQEEVALLEFLSYADARRLSEMETLLYWLSSLKKDNEPVLLCGDFNCEITSSAWQVLKQRGWLDLWEELGMSEHPTLSATWDPPRNPLAYRSQKFHQGGEGIGPGANEVLKRADALPRRIDFIALLQNSAILNPLSIKRFGCGDEAQYKKRPPFDFLGLPSHQCLSDHLGLFAQLGVS